LFNLKVIKKAKSCRKIKKKKLQEKKGS